MKRYRVSRRNELVVSAAALVGCVSIINFAHAQSAQPSRNAASVDTSAGELTEIVVTAQKRNEKLLEVPISITVVTSGDLDKAGVTNNLDLTQIVPGVKIDRVAGFTNPSIRGVSTFINLPGADPNTVASSLAVVTAADYLQQAWAAVDRRA